MYIPRELVMFILGFIAFPIVCVVVYAIRGDKDKDSEEEKK